MTARLDPEGNETGALLDYAGDFTGRHVLEIGSGDGRMTWRYAHLAGHVTGIEPIEEDVVKAIDGTPPELRGRVTFQPCGIEDYVHPPGARLFDVAIFSWSL